MSTQISPAVKPDQPSTRSITVDAQYAGTPPERPQVRHGRVRDNRPAPGRGTAPPSEHPVDSLRDARVSADTLDAIAAKLGV